MSLGGALALVGTGRASGSLARPSHFNRLTLILRRRLVQDKQLDDSDAGREHASSAPRHWRWVLSGLAATLLVGLLIYGVTGQSRNATIVRPAREGERTAARASSLLAGIQQHGNTLGDPKSPVTVKYFGDLQCPICRRFQLTVLPSLIESYVRTGKLKIEYHSLETATQTPSAFEAQQVAALAAGKQNKMWNFIELFYQEQGPEHSGYVTESYLQGLAQQVGGLNLIEWTAARNDPELVRTLATDARVAGSVGMNATPTFLIGHAGPRPPYLDAIKKQLEGLPSTRAGV